MPRSSLVSQAGFGGILILFCHGFPIRDEQMVLYISPGTVWHNAVGPKQGLTEPEVSFGAVIAWSRLWVAGHGTEAEQFGACRDGGTQRWGWGSRSDCLPLYGIGYCAVSVVPKGQSGREIPVRLSSSMCYGM